MSSANSTFTPLPSQTGEPYAVEVIEGAGKLRITRRGTVPAAYVEHSGRLAEVIEPYGTPDGVSAGVAGTRRAVPAERRWADAFLVEIRVVPRGDRANDQGAPEVRLVEKVYEQTPYARASSTSYDAQGAVTRLGATVVLAVGQDLGAVWPVPAGYTRTAKQSASEAGRLIWQVEDVRGDGVMNSGAEDDGDSVYADVTAAFPTEPAMPAIGTFLAWTKSARNGFWTTTTRRRLTNAEAGIAARTGRTQRAREDGSLVETATRTETPPVASLTGAYPIETSAVYRSGGVVAYSATWVKPPADWSYPDNIPWSLPGLVEVVGTTDVSIMTRPPVERVWAGVRAFSYGESQDPETNSIWQVKEGVTYRAMVELLDAKGGVGARFTEVKSIPNSVGTFNYVSTGGGKWCGANAGLVTIVGESEPFARPSGPTLIAVSVSPYLVALDGRRVFRKEKTTVNIA